MEEPSRKKFSQIHKNPCFCGLFITFYVPFLCHSTSRFYHYFSLYHIFGISWGVEKLPGHTKNDRITDGKKNYPGSKNTEGKLKKILKNVRDFWEGHVHMEYFVQGNAKITGTGFLFAAEDTEIESRREKIILMEKFGMNPGNLTLEIPGLPAKGAQAGQAHLQGFKEKFPEI